MTKELGSNHAEDTDLGSFLEQYEGGLERRYAKITTATPIHPETGELGTFVRFLRNYPVYKTSSGDEFIVQRGVPKSLKSLS